MARKLRIDKRIAAAGLALLVLCTGSFAYAQPSHGDMNGNGSLDAADAACILRASVQLQKLTEEQQRIADIDGDGSVSARDAAYILRYLIGIPTEAESCAFDFTMLVTGELKGAAWNKDLLTNSYVSGDCLRIADYLSTERSHTENLIVADAGNSLYGSVLSDLYAESATEAGGVMAQAFAAMNYDAVLLGDADFSAGLDVLWNDTNALTASGVTVLAANYLKIDATTADPVNAPFNGASPYFIKEFTNANGETLSVGVIGLSTTEGVQKYDTRGVNGMKTQSMLETYRYYEAELVAQCDVIIALIRAPIEPSQTDGSDENDCARALIEGTSTIDLAFCAAAATEGYSLYRNLGGAEIALISLADDAGSVAKAIMHYNNFSRTLTCTIDFVSMQSYLCDDALMNALQPAVNTVEMLMKLPVCDLNMYAMSGTDRYAPSSHITLLHQAQLWAIEQWRRQTDADAPQNCLSITYAYLPEPQGGWDGEYALTLRDLFALKGETPNYSLIIMKGKELKAWLEDYAGKIKLHEPIYSLAGLHYELAPNLLAGDKLVSLENLRGGDVQNDDVFVILVAEQGEVGTLLKPFFDTEWLPVEDHYLPDFYLPSFQGAVIPERYRSVELLAAYLEDEGRIQLDPCCSFIVR